MPFQKVCGTKAMHEEWNCPAPAGSVLHRGYLPREVMNALLATVKKSLNKNFYKYRPKFCESCIQRIYELHPELKPMEEEVENMPMMFEGERTEMHKDEPSPKRQRMVNSDNTCQTNSVIIIDSDNMSLSHLSSQECMKLAYALGKHEAKNVRDFALKVSNERNMEQLMKLDLKKYLSEMNAVVREFICGPLPSTDGKSSI